MRALFPLLISLFLASPVHADIVRDQLWVTDGTVRAVARWNNTIILGGSFSFVGPPVGCLATIDAVTGAALAPYSGIAGDVFAIAPDGSGGYFVGGDITGVHGTAQANLAHVDASGNLIQWNPNVDGRVDAIALYGSSVYIGGLFGHVGGQSRPFLAAVDAVTGAPTSWNPNSSATSAYVSTFLLDGSTLYVGGGFHNIGTATRNLIASFDLTTGSLNAWNPDGQASGVSVDAIAKLGSTIYLGGDFTQMGGQPRSCLAAVDATSGLATAFNPDVGGTRVQTIVPTQQTVSPFGITIWFGGDFSFVGGLGRANIAAVTGAGTLTTFNPGADSRVMALAVPTDGLGNAIAIYAGGQFVTLAGAARRFLGCLSPDGTPTAWDPTASGTVSTLIQASGNIVAGGFFESAGMTPRANLAALDATSGAVTPWNPGPNGRVNSLAVHGNTLYVGGAFSSFPTGARSGAAAFDLTSFGMTPWAPGLPCQNVCTTPEVYVVARPTFGNIVYLGGMFFEHLAAADTSAGGFHTFSGGPNGTVYCLAIRERDVAPFDAIDLYVGGAFTTVSVLSRNGVAEFDSTGAAVFDWNASAPTGTTVESLAFQTGYPGSVGTVFVGGQFLSMGGQSITGLAALDAGTGASKGWSIGTTGKSQDVQALILRSGLLYAGGSFTTIAGQTRGRLASFNATNGAIQSWAPSVGSGTVDALAYYGGTIYAGGSFNSVSNLAHPKFAGIGDGTVTAVEPGETAPRVTVLHAAPNPFREETSLSFSVPRREVVTIAIYDVTGRLVRLLYRGDLNPGMHAVTWDGRDGIRRPAAPGVYFARAHTQTQNLTTKIFRLR